MCAGTVLATAYAIAPDDTAQKSERVVATPNPFPAPVEQFAQQYPELYKQELESTNGKDGTFREICRGLSSADEIVDKLAEMGVTAYPTTDPKPVEEIDEQSLLSSGYPTASVTLPYRVAISETPANNYVITKNYFKANGTNIKVYYDFWTTGISEDASIKVTLYREVKYMAGADAWQNVSSETLTFSKYATSTISFTDLENSDLYVYCLKFTNTGTNSNNYVTGTAYIY